MKGLFFHKYDISVMFYRLLAKVVDVRLFCIVRMLIEMHDGETL